MTRRALAIAAAGVLVVGSVSAAVWAHGRPATPTGSWHQLPAPPIPAVANAIGLYTGTEVVFLGGDTHPCPPQVSCDALVLHPHGPGNNGMTRHAAAFDLQTQTWRLLAPVPAFVDDGFEAAYAAGHLYVDTVRGWFSYDVRDDSWHRFAGRWRRGYGLSPVGDRIYGLAHDRTTVVALDARTGRWTTYPPDPNLPRLGGVEVSGTPSGPVLGGYDTSQPYDIHHGSPALVDTWDGRTWRRLPQTGQMERDWVWTGRRLVDPAIGDQDQGDEYTWDRPYPIGGTLDPTTGRWQALPASLENAARGWVTSGAGWPAPADGKGWCVTDGRVYHDTTGRAWPLPRPPGDAQVYASGVWADGSYVVFGGASFSGQQSEGLSDEAWSYTP